MPLRRRAARREARRRPRLPQGAAQAARGVRPDDPAARQGGAPDAGPPRARHLLRDDDRRPAAGRRITTAPLDYEHYVEKQLAPIADAILVHVGLRFGEIVGEGGAARSALGVPRSLDRQVRRPARRVRLSSSCEPGLLAVGRAPLGVDFESSSPSASIIPRESPLKTAFGMLTRGSAAGSRSRRPTPLTRRMSGQLLSRVQPPGRCADASIAGAGGAVTDAGAGRRARIGGSRPGGGGSRASRVRGSSRQPRFQSGPLRRRTGGASEGSTVAPRTLSRQDARQTTTAPSGPDAPVGPA